MGAGAETQNGALRVSEVFSRLQMENTALDFPGADFISYADRNFTYAHRIVSARSRSSFFFPSISRRDLGFSCRRRIHGVLCNVFATPLVLSYPRIRSVGANK